MNYWHRCEGECTINSSAATPSNNSWGGSYGQGVVDFLPVMRQRRFKPRCIMSTMRSSLSSIRLVVWQIKSTPYRPNCDNRENWKGVETGKKPRAADDSGRSHHFINQHESQSTIGYRNRNRCCDLCHRHYNANTRPDCDMVASRMISESNVNLGIQTHNGRPAWAT